MNEDLNNSNNNPNNNVNNNLNNNVNNSVNNIGNNSGNINRNNNEDVVTNVNEQKNMNQDSLLRFENKEVDENPNAVTSADYPNGDHREETAAEFAPTRGLVGQREFAKGKETENEHASEGRGVGTFAIVLSIISLFFLPVILGAAGIIVGFIARRNKATGLGNAAIGIGAISIILTLFFSPFF